MKKLNLKKYSSILALILAPSISFSQVGLSKLAEDQKYSIVAVMPNLEGYPELKSDVKDIQKDLMNLKDQVAKSVVENMFMPQGLTSAFSILAKQIQTQLEGKIKSLNSKLPSSEGPVVSIYLMPYAETENAMTVTNVPLAGEVQAVDVNLEGMSKRQENDFYYKRAMAIRSLPAVTNDKMHFTALAIHLKLQKDYSEVLVQVLGELKSGISDFIKSNEQVNIKKLDILSDSKSGSKPMVLINLRQKISKYTKPDESPITQFRIEFGTFGGFSGDLPSQIEGEMLILRDHTSEGKRDCSINLNSVPTLTGELVQPTRIEIVDAALKKLGPVRFRIQSIDIDPETLKVKKMEVPTGLGKYTFLQCLPIANVGEQFSKETNDTIENLLLAMVMQNDLTSDLVDSLLL